MKRQSLNLHLVSAISLLIILNACSKEESSLSLQDTASTQQKMESAPGKKRGRDFLALTATNELIKYKTGHSLIELSSLNITGLNSGERVLAIDFRPSTGQLFGVSNMSRILIINHETGYVTPVSSGPFSPAINGTMVGFDFNPTVDRIRLVTNQDQNLRINPQTGMVAATDGNINPPGSTVTSVAYTNSFAGATTTTLYDIDVENDKLYKQNPPNAGILEEVGLLGVQATGEAGFDIAPDNSMAIAVLYGRGYESPFQPLVTPGNKYRFYYINLQTGQAMNAGKTAREIIGLAIIPNPE